MGDIIRQKSVLVSIVLIVLVVIFGWFYSSEYLSKTGQNGMDIQQSDQPSLVFMPKGQIDPLFKQTRQAQTESFVPSDAQLKQMDLKALMTTFHTYQDHFEFLCIDQKRIGTVFDGGKHVCVDPEIRPKNNDCLVYSFGSRNEFSFERDAISWFGCEVHTFDPFTASSSGTPKGCTFHKLGLGGYTRNVTKPNGVFQIKSLDDIMAKLKHTERVIDILKIDIDLYEWEFMENVIKTGLLSRKVKQFQVELHWYDQYQIQNRTNVESTLGTLRNLYGTGFRIFSRERNVFCPSCTKLNPTIGIDVTYVTELCYINQRFVSDFYKTA